MPRSGGGEGREAVPRLPGSGLALADGLSAPPPHPPPPLPGSVWIPSRFSWSPDLSGEWRGSLVQYKQERRGTDRQRSQIMCLSFPHTRMSDRNQAPAHLGGLLATQAPSHSHTCSVHTLLGTRLCTLTSLFVCSFHVNSRTCEWTSIQRCSLLSVTFIQHKFTYYICSYHFYVFPKSDPEARTYSCTCELTHTNI